MSEGFKENSFKLVYWVMIILLAGDTVDTTYRFIIIGYFGEGASFPGVDSFIKPTSIAVSYTHLTLPTILLV